MKSSSKLVQYPGENTKGFYKIQYRFMRGTTISDAHKMIHQMALAFGYKRSILFSDECIALLFEALNTRISRTRSLCDSEHSRWLEKYFGLAVLAKEFVKAFSQKRHKKKLKTLISLTSTLIPIICTDILWNLPSSNQRDFTRSDESSSNIHHVSSSLELLPLSISSAKKDAKSYDTVVYAEALNGNGALVICLMDFVSSLALNLRSDFKKFIPTVLYPLVQKTSDLNSGDVRDAAILSLYNISSATGYSNLEEMLHDNYSYLMETLISELSAPQKNEIILRSQAICFYSLHNIIEFMLKRQESVTNEKAFEMEMLLLIDMQVALTKWFNVQYRETKRKFLQDISVPMGLLSVFISSTAYLHEILSSLESKNNHNDGVDSIQFRWEDLLLEFEMPGIVEETKGEETKEKEVEMGCDDSSTKEVGLSAFDTNDDVGKIKVVSAHVLSRLTRSLEDVLTINSNLLSHQNLLLQTKACEFFTVAFRLLSSIQHHAKVSEM